MGLFNKKISVDEAINRLIEYAESSDESESIIVLRGKEKNGSFNLTDGAVSCSLTNLPKLLIESAKGDEQFAKSIITTSESLKHNVPEMKDFCNKLTSKVRDINTPSNGRMADMEAKIKEKFPNAEVMSVDITKINDMDDESFQKIVDNIYRASQRASRDNGDKG